MAMNYLNTIYTLAAISLEVDLFNILVWPNTIAYDSSENNYVATANYNSCNYLNNS